MGLPNSFYVHLPSHNVASRDNNTVGRYTTHLKQPIRFGFDWEVALTEISYTKSWYNVNGESSCSVLSFGLELDKTDKFIKYVEHRDADKTILVSEDKSMDPDETIIINLPVGNLENIETASGLLDNTTLASNTSSNYLYKILIEPGYYTTKDLIETINSELTREQIKLEPNASFSRVPWLELGKDGHVSTLTGKRKTGDKMADTFLNISGDAAKVLGFSWDGVEEFREVNTSYGKKHKKTSSEYPDRTGGVYSMFVHSDIVKSVHVGETMSNVLRIVEVPEKSAFGEQVTISYAEPQYKRVASNEISSIEIYIKDDRGSYLPFRFGRTIITLHFRKININI